jgi:hypothetical protein
MSIGREAAIQMAMQFYSSQGATVLRSRDELPSAGGASVLVLLRVVHSSDTPFHPPEMVGRFWWVAFEEFEWQDGRWEEPSIHPSGGLVRIDEETGEVYHPTLL